MPSRDDDLDWLYGGDGRAAPPPEPTRRLPDPGQPPGGPPSQYASVPSAPVYGSVVGSTAPPVAPPAYPSTPGFGPRPTGAPAWGAPGGPSGPGGPPPYVPGRSPGSPPKKRHPVRTVLIVVLVVVLAALVALIGIPLHAWSQVQRVADAPAGSRPPGQPGTTYLLVGSDSRAGLTAEQRKKLGTGSAAGQRTDTIMIMYVPRSGRPALISIPRDSYVPIPGNGSNKINAAYAFGGPKLLVKTVEQSTGLRVDAYAEIGFGGFVDIIDSLGGIEMCLPKAIKDRDSHLDLKKGCQTLNGTNALGYVRMRKADPRGDLGRVERQRQMLAAVAKAGASPATVVNPVRYWQVSHATAQALTLGEGTSLFQTASMALAMKKVSQDQGLTLTVPVSNPGASTPVGSAVLWDNEKARAMFADIARGNTSRLDKYAK